MKAGDSFFGLKNYAKGKINKYELMDSDPLIYNVTENRNNPAQSEIYLQFDNSEKLLEMLGLSEDDVWAAGRLGNYYQPYEYFDSYQQKQYFLEGHGMWHDLSDDNMDLVKNIFKLLGKGDFDGDQDRQTFAEEVYDLFPKLIDSLVNDYTYEKNHELNTTAAEGIRKEISDYVEDYGFKLFGLEGLYITVADLISAYIQHNVPHLSIDKLLKKIFPEQSSLGGWAENMYEYQNDENFDKESFNKEAERIFEKIYEELEKNDEGYKSFLEMVDRVSNKFKKNVWYDLPKNKKYKIKIKGYDKKSGNKIDVIIVGPSYKREFKISEDGFYKLLYNLELFDFVDK